MYNIWPIVIISISFLVIIFIISRHFSALAVLDVDNIPEEKEGRIKEKIIRERIRRRFVYFDKFFNEILNFFDNIFEYFHLKLDSLKQKQKEEKDDKMLSKISSGERMKILLSQAKSLTESDDWVGAEKKLIEVISLDDKNFMAFWELGEVYCSQEKWQEARQTLLYALKLADVCVDKIASRDVSSLNYSLALINKELNDIEGAFLNVRKALQFESNNPRYLDLILDLCIIKKDKELSFEYLNKIKEVNPENNNIPDWQESVDKLPM